MENQTRGGMQMTKKEIKDTIKAIELKPDTKYLLIANIAVIQPEDLQDIVNELTKIGVTGVAGLIQGSPSEIRFIVLPNEKNE